MKEYHYECTKMPKVEIQKLEEKEKILGQYAVIREAVLANIHRQTREKTE